MADTIERLYKLTVDGTTAARQLGEIERATTNLDKRFAAVGDGIKKFAGIMTAAFSVGAIVNGIKSVTESFDQLSKDAQKVGIAAEDLQRLRFAADMSGVSAEKLDSGITRLAQAMGNLDDKGNKAAGVLRAVGVSGGDSAVAALKKVADQFAAMPDGMEKTAAAADLFGKAIGPDMIPLLNAGSKELEKLTKEADQFGGVVSGSVLKSAEAFNDNLARLQRTAAGVGMQLTAGMLPALQAISQSLTESATSGEGFVTAGEKIGEMLGNLYGFALKAGATLQAFGMILGGLAAQLTATSDEQSRTIWRSMIEDIDELDKTTNEKLASLRDNFAKFKADASAPTAAPVATGATNRLVDGMKAAEEAAKAQAKAIKELNEALIKQAEAADEANFAQAKLEADAASSDSPVLRQLDQYMKLNQEMRTYLDNIEAEGARIQILTDWLEEGTEAQKAYARSQLEVVGAQAASSETMKKQKDELDVIDAGFENFFENLASGTADVEDLFKRMVQSIIAELLKLWAKKYIVDAIAGAFGFKTAAKGAVVDTAGVQAFANGGIVQGPTFFRAAKGVGLMGEAGPEAIMPLQRNANGDLGVAATAPVVNIEVINNHSGATVSAEPDDAGNVRILVERVRAEFIRDIRSGGNSTASAFEQTFGLNRAAGAR